MAIELGMLVKEYSPLNGKEARLRIVMNCPGQVGFGYEVSSSDTQEIWESQDGIVFCGSFIVHHPKFSQVLVFLVGMSWT